MSSGGSSISASLMQSPPSSPENQNDLFRQSYASAHGEGLLSEQIEPTIASSQKRKVIESKFIDEENLPDPGDRYVQSVPTTYEMILPSDRSKSKPQPPSKASILPTPLPSLPVTPSTSNHARPKKVAKVSNNNGTHAENVMRVPDPSLSDPMATSSINNTTSNVQMMYPVVNQKAPAASKKKAGRPAATKRTSVAEAAGEEGDEKTSRFDSSLSLLTKRFTDLVRGVPEGVVDLNDCAVQLGVQKRRIYDITNVLEGINLIEKKSKNHIHWRGSGLCTPQERQKIEELKLQIEDLRRQEAVEDEKTRNTQQSLKQMVEDYQHSKWAYITHDDVRNLPGMENQTLIAIKAPAGTRLEVPDPDEGMDGGDRRYQIFLQSENGAAIDVYLVSSEAPAPAPTTDTTQFLEEGISLNPKDMHYETEALVRIAPPPETDEYFTIMEGEGISDFYTEDTGLFG
ncbi:transcription factor E2F [Planoprotostelium fungivorum]|uniref:Transcription factor E2F n=1 Tax=Planoprotostelium fungivorum TaxID=1890364 RepID=A0A2P6NLK4_9EUKA|nr:transcription factor E2F [Planoprotostelium fungivorum]